MMIIVCYQDAGVLHGCFFLFLYFPNFLLMIYSAIKNLFISRCYDKEAGPSFSRRLNEDKAKVQ